MAEVDVGTRILDKVLKSLSILNNNQNISRIVGVDSINPVFTTGAYTNKQLYDLISSTVESESSTTVKVLAENFTKSVLYLYQLLKFTSNLENLQSGVQTALGALKTAYQSNIGDVVNFPDAILEWASPPTTWKILLDTVDVSQVLNSPPIGGENVIPSILNYINAKKALQNAENENECNQSIVKSLITATTNPTLPNACQFKDPPSIKPLYKMNLSSKDQIEPALSNSGSSIDVNFKIVKSQQKMTIDFNSGDSIDVSSFINQDWFTETAGNTSISISNLFTLMSSFEISVQFVWKGITVLSPTPASYPNGWYSAEQINEAIRNSKNHNSSGWQFSKTPNLSSVSIISQLFISNPPQISVLAKNTSKKANFMNNLPRGAPVPNEVDDITGFNLFGWSFQFACSYHSNITINASSIECTFLPTLNNASSPDNCISILLGVIVSTPFFVPINKSE